jgi:hypothetical protein
MSFEHFEGLVMLNRRAQSMDALNAIVAAGMAVRSEFNNRKLVGIIAILLSSEYSHKPASTMRTLPCFSEPGYNAYTTTM